MELQYNKKAADAPFEVGQRCWVYTPSSKKGLSKELPHLWHRPFHICCKLPPVHYQLRTYNIRLVPTTVHANRRKHFHKTADRPIAPPQEDDPNQLSLQESDFPADSFEPENSQTKTSTPIDAALAKDNGELPKGTPVNSSDVLMEPDVYAAEKILKARKRPGNSNTFSNGQISQPRKACGNWKKTSWTSDSCKTQYPSTFACNRNSGL